MTEPQFHHTLTDSSQPGVWARWLGLAVCLLSTTAGCAFTPPGRLGPEVALPARSVVVFWADGVDHRRFDEMVTAGQLPNITRVFIEGGVTVEAGIDSMPSLTYPNGASLITGRFPGHNGIAGNLWLDRRTLQSSFYLTPQTYLDTNSHIQGATIYDMLSDQFTLNIGCHTRRGVSRSVDSPISYGLHWFTGALAAFDAEMPGEFAGIAAIARQTKRWPTLITTYCSGIDEVGHRFGPDSPQYTEALKTIDSNVGRIAEILKSVGMADRTCLLLVSDHGMVPTPPAHSMDLRRWLRSRRHLKIRCEPLDGDSFTQCLAQLDDYDAFVAVESDRHASIHIRGEQGWTRTPLPGEVERFILADPSLLKLPAVDCAAMRDGPDRVKVFSDHGSAVIEREIVNQQKRYRLLILDGDPLNYDDEQGISRFIAAGWHDSRDWLAATCRTDHPDFVPQIVEMFDSPRAGDITLFASDEAAFSTDSAGGHGSCTLRDMHVVQLYAGPGIPAGTSIACNRFVDVAPTVLGLLGESQRLKRFPPLDGIDLSREIRSAKRLTALAQRRPAQGNPSVK